MSQIVMDIFKALNNYVGTWYKFTLWGLLR